VATTLTTKRAEALGLADELLADIELGRLPPQDVARKTYRLARVLDDQDAMAWLHFEVNGYRLVKPANVFEPGGWEAAVRSNRDYLEDDGKRRASATSLGELQAELEATRIQLAAAVDPSVSLHSANQHQIVTAPAGNANERLGLRRVMTSQQAVIDKVLGAIHTYVVNRYQELRFGHAAETAFETVRSEVDRRISALVPDAPGMFAAAFESAASDNPEHWAGAAATCRRLLKAAADALRPPGPAVDGREMTDRRYINRLIDWILAKSQSETAAAFVTSDLEYLGSRLDAVDEAGHKGAHASVSRFDAARFLTGTYLALGDILQLVPESSLGLGDAAPDAHGLADEISNGAESTDSPAPRSS
jgi:hypothetical protein